MSAATRRALLIALMSSAAPWLPARAGQAPSMPLPALWSEDRDPASYLVSEKYDGVRALWDGRMLRHRSGRAVNAPRWFIERLPDDPLDGELWLDRGRFDALSAIVRRRVPLDSEWRRLRYMVFELPDSPERFAERARRISDIARAANWPALVAVEQSAVADRAELQRRLARTVAAGGEGLVLHRADAPYRTGRSDAMFKLKPELDTEATVVAHHPGRGKYQGQLGALELRTPQGRQFLLGSGLSDALRRDPPPLGSVVTYRYRDLTGSGLPRFASFLRVHDAL